MRITIMVIALIMIAPEVRSHESCARAECEETKQKIRQIQSKMRSGYTRKQGEKMESDLRKLRAIRSKKCR